MNDRKHIVVGLFVLGGLVLLGVLVVWFGSVAGLIRGGYKVYAHLPSAVGIRKDKRVHRDGIEIGAVKDVQPSLPKELKDVQTSLPEEPGVWIEMQINSGELIPANAEFVAQRGMAGDVYLDFRSTRRTTHYLRTNDTATAVGRIKPPSLLPEDVMKQFYNAMEKFDRLEALLANLSELTEPRTLQDVEAGKRKNLWTTLAQFQDTARTIDRQLTGKDTGQGLGRLLVQAGTAAEELQKTLKQARTTLEGA
ncbi:MAG: hypothetical protein U9R68_02945, partial [Planctomycetota bacterium]|nr:hypothetical protein [Planctomycetota bacterium]